MAEFVSRVESALERSMHQQENQGRSVDDLFQGVRRLFNRRTQRTRGNGSRRRGPVPSTSWNTQVFLLGDCSTKFLPPFKEMERLGRNGLGIPNSLRAGPRELEDAKVSIDLGYNRDEIDGLVRELYPNQPLGRYGFRYMKATKGRLLVEVKASNARDLKSAFKKGKIYLLPNRTIVPQIASDEDTHVSDIDSESDDSLADFEDAGTPTVMFHRRSQSSRGTSAGQRHRGDERHVTNVALAPATPPETASAPVSFQHTAAPASANPPETASAPVSFQHTAARASATPPETASRSAPEVSSPNPSAVPTEDAPGVLRDAPTETVNVGLEFDIQLACQALQHCLGEEKVTVSVRREHVMDTVLAIYKDEKVPTQQLYVEFVDESGDDFGGLTKELFTSFWSNARQDLFSGEHVVVPSLPLHRMNKDSWKYKALGRVLSHTVALTGNVPAVLARSTILQMIFQSDVDEKCLLEDFMLYITDHEKTLLEKALMSFSTLSQSELARLQDFYMVYGYHDIPRAAEIKDQVLTIANQEMVVKPKQLVALMRQGIPPSHLDTFWEQLTLDHVTYLLDKQRPTPSKVVGAIKTEYPDLASEEDRALYFLKEFILSMDNDMLLTFLNFVTGSIHTPQSITVQFTKLIGLERRPVMHTCSNLIELPSTYHSFQEFKREFNNILGNNEALRYTIL